MGCDGKTHTRFPVLNLVVMQELRGITVKSFVEILFIAFVSTPVLAGQAVYENLSITIPDGWAINYSIIENEKGEKVGEFMSKSAFETDTPIESGNDFILAIKKGVEIEGDFIESGNHENIYWTCTSNAAFGDEDGPILWFARTFWNNGFVVILYSKVSCKENFEQALKIAKSMHAK